MKTPHNKKHSLLAAVALVTIGAGGLWTWLGGDAADEPRLSPLAQLAPGTRRIFDLDLETRVFTGGGQAGHYHVTGRWIVQAGDQPGRVYALVEDARMDSSFADAGQKPAMAAAGAELASPIELAVDGRGLITEVRENPRVTAQARSLQKAMAFYSQFSDATRAAHWQSSEQDGTGSYDAVYTRTGRGQFERRKQAYTALLHASEGLADQAKVEVQDSQHQFRFAADGHLESLAVSERLAAGGQFVDGLSTTTTMTLKFVGEEPAPRLAVVRESLEVVDRPQLAASLDPSPEADVHRVAGRSFDELVGLIESLPPAKERDEEQQRAARVAFIALGARFRLDDAAVDQALDAIRSGSPVSRTLWDALASAGTPRAQAALREIIDMPFSMVERRMQMVGLSMVHNPTPETVAFLHGRIDNPEQGIQARYGLGSAIYHLKERRPEAARDVFNIVVGELNQETDVAEKAAMLVALGNAGYAPSLPVLTPYLKSPDERLRRAAARGLRQLPDAEVDGLLAGLALDDRSETVRIAAVEVLSSRTPSNTVVNALVEAYEDDEDEGVRELAEHALDEMATKVPAIAEQLNRREEARANRTE